MGTFVDTKLYHTLNSKILGELHLFLNLIKCIMLIFLFIAEMISNLLSYG